MSCVKSPKAGLLKSKVNTFPFEDSDSAFLQWRTWKETPKSLQLLINLELFSMISSQKLSRGGVVGFFFVVAKKNPPQNHPRKSTSQRNPQVCSKSHGWHQHVLPSIQPTPETTKLRQADAVLELGHGARRNVRFLRGDEKTRFDFGEAGAAVPGWGSWRGGKLWRLVSFRGIVWEGSAVFVCVFLWDVFYADIMLILYSVCIYIYT